MANKKAIIIGAGVAGPVMALQLKKAGYDSVIFESREESNTKEGAFLGFTPNGLNVLKEFVEPGKLKTDSTSASMKFVNAKGKEVAELNTAYQKEKYGIETIQLKRADLNKYAREAAVNNGITIYYNRKFMDLTEENNQVTAYFQDGTIATADILIACDGIFSAVRKKIFPDTSVVRYTKLISTGGYANLYQLSEPTDSIIMTFGERGFFGYSVSNHGETWWFNNYYREEEPKPGEMETIKQEIKQYLLELHKNDDPLINIIISLSNEILVYPVYDIPTLPQWFKGRVCLVGDAAHGVSPHVGQGASLALEDTLVLAMMLKNEPTYETAFQRFQEERQQRVEKIIKHARKIGDTKSKPNPVAVWFRDKLLRFFIKGEIKKLDWIYGWTYPEKKR